MSNAPDSHYEQLANIPFPSGYPSKASIQQLKDELVFQRAVQSYLWALPVLNMYGMKDGSEKAFGAGYNVLPIFKDRLNAKTLVTTPNSDVIYAMGYVDLKDDGPLVIEVPPGLQGILDDFFQRPICSEGMIEGRTWCGDVGLPGPDHGKGAKYLLLPPDYQGAIPKGYLTFRSRTYGVFVFWRGFFKDPTQLEGPVRVMEQTKIYPLGKEVLRSRCSFRTLRRSQRICFTRRMGKRSTFSRGSLRMSMRIQRIRRCVACWPPSESSKDRSSSLMLT